MNNDPINPPGPPSLPMHSAREVSASHILEPIKGAVTFLTVFETILRRPGQILHALGTGRLAVAGWLVCLLVLGLAIFGFLLGTFSGGMQLWAAPTKLVAGVLISALICLPSFYIFLCLGGASIRFSTACGLLLTALALVALLLLALAPVVWLFTQATESIGFMGFLALGFWLVGTAFGLQLLVRGAKQLGGGGTVYLLAWAIIFLAVTLQMSTALRPILGRSERWLPTQRKFFLEHWGDNLGRESAP